MSKHTPAPWIWNSLSDWVERSGYGDNDKRCGDLDGPNGSVLYTTHADDGVHVYSIADAKLIAAAPDLLEALIEARGMVESWAEYADEYYKEKWNLKNDLEKLDSVIAKAGGQL